MSDQPPAPENPVSPEVSEIPSVGEHSSNEWIAVPPPHPYAAGQQQRGKGIAMSAMALGLVALLTVTVSAFYYSVFALLGAGLGLVAIVLGAVALVKRSPAKAGGLVGIVSGALSMLLTAVLAVLGIVALASNLAGGQGLSSGSGGSWSSDEPAQSLIEWPANMASGGVVLEGPGDPLPRSAPPLEAGTAPQPARVDRAAANDVLIYVDYRCPHCLVFEQTNEALIDELLRSGTATVEIVPLSFLDRVSEGAYYSSRAAGAIACIADSQPTEVLAAHKALLTPEVQPGAGPGLDNEQLVEVLDAAVGGLDPATSDCITTERFVPFAQAFNEWVFTQPVPHANEADMRLSGTPSIFVNGDFYDGPLTEAAQFRAFVEGRLN